LSNVSKKLAKVVEFTLEQKYFQIFPKFLTKRWKIVFGKNHWKFAWLKKKKKKKFKKKKIKLKKKNLKENKFFN